MAKAGYDPNEAIRFWRRFANVKSSKKTPEFLSTHPTDKTRIRLINRYLPRAKLIYNTLKVKYGLGKTIQVMGIKPNPNQKESIPKSPKSIPNISVETLR